MNHSTPASLTITNSPSLFKLMPIESVMPSSHLILCRPLLLMAPIPPSLRVFSSESTLRMRWPKYWSFSFSIRPSNEHPGLISTHQFGIIACMCAKSLQLCWTLCDPMDCNLPEFSVHGILQARILEWVAISTPRGYSRHRDQTHVSYVSCIARQVRYH